MKIVNSADFISIGLYSFPKNSIFLSENGKNGLSISVIGTSSPSIIIDDWSTTTNERGESYATKNDLIFDIMRSQNPFNSTNDQILIDEVSDLVTYIGYSKPGTASSEPYWAIQKITSTSTSTPSSTKMEWAISFKNRTNIWDNRASLIYV